MRNNRGSVTTLILIVLIVAAIIWFLAPKFINTGNSVATSAGTQVENAAQTLWDRVDQAVPGLNANNIPQE
jgi:ABC-type Fe3+-siderophore transport system permease subunit